MSQFFLHCPFLIYGMVESVSLFLKFMVMHACNTTYTGTRYIIYLMVLHDNLLKKEEKHTDIQYKSKPKYILWQHRTFHIPLWDKGHTTPEVFDFFFFLKYTLFFFYVCSLHVIISIMPSIKWATGSPHKWVWKIFQKQLSQVTNCCCMQDKVSAFNS